MSHWLPPRAPACFPYALKRSASSSSQRWQLRHTKDRLAVQAKVQGLKSRAAFKLLEINDKYRLFKRGQTVVDLGYAPGSWSQVAVDRTHPTGRVVGIDIIPAQPPKGVSTIQGNFLSRSVQDEVKQFLRESDRGRMKPDVSLNLGFEDRQVIEDYLRDHSISYLEAERRVGRSGKTTARDNASDSELGDENKKSVEQRVVDVVLSDMMMNTSGMSFRDHACSMDLCYAALQFALDVLKAGGHFVCKFYQGSESKALESRLKLLFAKVHLEKPESSRSVRPLSQPHAHDLVPLIPLQESREAYFVALKRRDRTSIDGVFHGR